jgi:hypothetical protein
MSTKPIDPKASYNITAAASLLGIKPFHMHELLLAKGDKPARIPAQKELIPGTKTQRWVVKGSELIKYAETRKSGVGQRADGRNKYTIHLTAEELAKVQKFLGTLPEVKIARANPSKSKE